MGVAYEFVEIDFDNWMADLETYRIDCFLGGLEITPEREQIVSYSTPYLYETDLDVQYGFALRKNSNAVEFFNFMILSEADIGFINDLLNKYWPE